jgi:hypothetical protein
MECPSRLPSQLSIPAEQFNTIVDNALLAFLASLSFQQKFFHYKYECSDTLLRQLSTTAEHFNTILKNALL